jgi:hypothetical protein
MPHRLTEQTVTQAREAIRAVQSAGGSVAEAVAAAVPVLRASAEALAQLLTPGAVSSEVEKRLKV